MRIAHCIHGLGLGGAQKVIATLVRNGQTVAPRVNTHFVYSSSDGVLRGEIEQAGADVSIVERRFRRIDPTWIMALRRTMEQDQVDLVHCHLFGDTLHGYLAARPLGIPVVATVHTEYAKAPTFQRWGYRLILPRLAAAVACGKGAQRSLSRAMPQLETLVIPNGIEPIRVEPDQSRSAIGALKSELGIPNEALLVAAIGRLTKEKAPAFLIEAFARTERQEAHLIFLGDGPLRPALEATQLDDRSRRRIHFAGFRNGITELLPGLDIVVFSSDHEGLSIALLEAMATGRALVVTDAPGILEAVSDQNEALVVMRRDTSALAAAIDRLIAQPEQRRELGGAALQRFEAAYSAERMVESYHQLYRSLVRARRPGSRAAQASQAPVGS